MSTRAYPENWFDIDKSIYHRSVKVFGTVRNHLGVKMKLHADQQSIQGDIFLFNHFSRFETFIPQYLIFQETGAYSCAIAAGEFFQEENVLSNYLSQVGVFPHDHPRLFVLLAAQILRGRKVIIFPEGGMVKDRRVLDSQGKFSIYSRITGGRRKMHTGAAVLAQGVDVFKVMIRQAYQSGNYTKLLRWQNALQIDNLDSILISALKPTLIIPSNITFYPIRSSENLLLKGVEMLTGGLTTRQTEELLIEGNILLKNTDMDIRMGKPVDPSKMTNRLEHTLKSFVLEELDSLDDVYLLTTHPKNWRQKILGLTLRQKAGAVRDSYMKHIYTNVTINLSHLASTLIMYCIENGQNRIQRQCLFNTLYISVKRLQNNAKIYLHESLLNPDDYGELIHGTGKRFEQFICMAKTSNLIDEDEEFYHFKPKLLEELDFDEIRLENLIAVYNNEVEPIPAVRKTVVEALSDCGKVDPSQLAGWQFEDECLDLKWEIHNYTKPQYNDINAHETATADPYPFFLLPDAGNGIGVLLIHGLLASPAELKEYGLYLQQRGYSVISARLNGHGSSPYALREQSWEDWYTSVIKAYKILKIHCDRIIVTGFSTGGALALKLASESFPELIGVSAAAVPLKFINPAVMLVPLLHGTNKLVRWVSSLEGIKPFIENGTEHPWINYHHVPVRALYELRVLIQHMNDYLPKINIPVLIIQGENDPVVSVKSASELMAKIGSSAKQLRLVKSNRHSILMENIGKTWQLNDDFFEACARETFFVNSSQKKLE